MDGEGEEEAVLIGGKELEARPGVKPPVKGESMCFHIGFEHQQIRPPK